MAEAEKVYVIHNMCRAQSSRAQRAEAVTQHRAALWIDGQKVLPKRPLKISVATFNLLEDSIIKKLREGRLAFTTPEQYYVDSRPDGRIYVVRPGHQIVEEKAVSSDHWRLLFEKPTAPEGELPVPLKDWVGPGPTGMTGPDCGDQSLGPQGLPGVVPAADVVPPVSDDLVVAVNPEESAPTTSATEEVTQELPDPNAMLTLDTPTSTPVEDLQVKSKKRRR
jgi:hypothetical protein